MQAQSRPLLSQIVRPSRPVQSPAASPAAAPTSFTIQQVLKS